MNIVLTGLRGSGKTKVGKLLAEKLGWNFVDLDNEIEKLAGKLIPEIIEEYDWEHFRKLEEEVCTKAGKLDNTVIATGGGAIINPTNEKALKENGKIVYLKVPPKICAQRISNSKSRPALTDTNNTLEEMIEIYEQRKERYEMSAHIIFDRTDSIKEDTEKLSAIL